MSGDDRKQRLPDDGRTRYFRADHSTLGTSLGPRIPWWLVPADNEVGQMRDALTALAEKLEVEGFVGHEECPIPGEPGYPQHACKACRALTLVHQMNGTAAEALDDE